MFLSSRGSRMQRSIVFLVFGVQVGFVAHQTGDTVTVTWRGERDGRGNYIMCASGKCTKRILAHKTDTQYSLVCTYVLYL